MVKENLQIARFTTQDVLPTKVLEKMTNAQLIKHIQGLEEHALKLDYGLTLLLDNLQSVKKAKQKADNFDAMMNQDQQ